MRPLVVLFLLAATFSPAQTITGEKDLSGINKLAYAALDGYLLQTVIANGNLELLDPARTTDVQLGVLSVAELRLLRNTVFALHGYIFSSTDLDQHFRAFPWYTPTKANVDDLLSSIEKGLIERIKVFETPSPGLHATGQKELIGTWKEFTGGADQDGIIIRLNANGQFIYSSDLWPTHRTSKLTGTWKFADSRIVLDVAEQDLLFGGHYVLEPDAIGIEDGISAKILYNHNFTVRLPVQSSQGMPGYPDESGTWKRIGSTVFYPNG